MGLCFLSNPSPINGRPFCLASYTNDVGDGALPLKQKISLAYGI